MAAGGTEPGQERDSDGGTDADPEGGAAVREAALLLARFATNNHTICDEELRPIGALLCIVRCAKIAIITTGVLGSLGCGKRNRV
jgi:hypothetical protein